MIQTVQGSIGENSLMNALLSPTSYRSHNMCMASMIGKASLDRSVGHVWFCPTIHENQSKRTKH